MHRKPILLFLILASLLFGTLLTSSHTAASVEVAQTNTAVVTAGNLNVRSGPSVGFSIKTVISNGTTVTLVGRNSDSSWIYIRLADSSEGWVNGAYLNPSVAYSTLPLIDTPETKARATVTTGALNVRSGPNIAYNAFAILQQGSVVELLGRNSSITWVQIRLTDQRTGWVNASFIEANIAINSLPLVQTTSTDFDFSARVTTGALNVRRAPGIEYEVVTIIYQWQQVTMLGRNSSSTWVKIRISSEIEGWVNATYIQSNFPISSLPLGDSDQPLPTPVPGDPASTPDPSGTALNMRSGPGTSYAIVGQVVVGQQVALLGRNSAGTWIKIQSGGVQGWVSAAYVQASVPIGSLPVVDS